jgi:hypothetical protein
MQLTCQKQSTDEKRHDYYAEFWHRKAILWIFAIHGVDPLGFLLEGFL